MDFDIQRLAIVIPPLLVALIIHECAHAWMANRLGDDTAAREGRLTLNPLAHLDPLGTLMLLFSGLIGWAKPVPVNPVNLRNPVRDMTLVALAGPLSNLALAVVVAILCWVYVGLGLESRLPESIHVPLLSMLFMAGPMNIGLALFNMLPIPPLDGFRVLSYFLKAETQQTILQYQPFILIGFLVLLWLGFFNVILFPMIGVIWSVISPIWLFI